MAKAEDPASPLALQALLADLQNFSRKARENGRVLFDEGRVIKVWKDDVAVDADVETDEGLHEPSLLWQFKRWSSDCSCNVDTRCQHAYAAGYAWLKQCKFVLPSSSAKLITATALATPPKKKLTFRQEWAPVIEQKLGRTLSEDEAHSLGRLSALFSSFKSYGQLSTYLMNQHGFKHSSPPVEHAYGYGYGGAIYADWWDPHRAPADPWALWQYIAYDWERAGWTIPEVFRPMTDTTKVRALLEDRLVQRELEVWRQTFRATTAIPAARASTSESAKIADVRLCGNFSVGPDEARGFYVEIRPAADKPWKATTQKWLNSLVEAGPADFQHLPAAAAVLANALAAECHRHLYDVQAKSPLPERVITRILAVAAAHSAIFLADGSPWRVETERLSLEACVSAQADRLDLQLVAPDGSPATGAKLLMSQPEPLYAYEGRIYPGPPPLPTLRIPTKALSDPAIMTRFRAIGLRLPQSLELKVEHVRLSPVLRCSMQEFESYYEGGTSSATFFAQLIARSNDRKYEQSWSGHRGWSWTDRAPPPRRAGDPVLEFDLTAANAVGAHFAEFKLVWFHDQEMWGRNVTKNFPEEFSAWRAALPADLTLEASSTLAGLIGPPLKGQLTISAAPAGGTSRDWFDLTVDLKIADTTLSKDEITLLLKARGKWVRLPKHGWQRLELSANTEGEAAAALDRLGLRPDEVFETGRATTHRLHALQLAAEADTLARQDNALAAALRERAATIAALPPPALPADLHATLRPYQAEGFHFLAHLSANGFGGVLADDMGLGKTVQALTWLLHLATIPRPDETVRNTNNPISGLGADVRNTNKSAAPSATDPRNPNIVAFPGPEGTVRITNSCADTPRPFRALIVCPKSVMHGWLTETARFTPTLAATAFTPALTAAPLDQADKPTLLIANYAQLRLQGDWLLQQRWDAVILDEAQYIKNPTSQAAVNARALPATHRLALTGTPIENRLLDLWSIFAFAQPGLLGTQASFRRLHPDDDPAAPERLRRRARHFMLRRTKGQVATDLPSRTEDEIIVDLEGGQRTLYDAELKRARAMLLGLETDRALDAVRFNILASLLRLRQICCHPALIDSAHQDLPSAKLDALLEQIEELHDEGHQVLVFSQFIEMLEIIQARLVKSDIGHLMLTGQTENRAELVEKFQSDRTKTVFLLSLKAAGSGLNLTAASYVILCDPWWNPAVEAQAIDRTHRIGQTRPVIAYRLLAANTIEQKIRALQKEKAALAATVVQEESLAKVLDLESLRQILS